MDKLNLSGYKQFSRLPLGQFNEFKFSVYVLDFQWNYLFVNDFCKNNLGARGRDLLGKNMWETFEELGQDPVFIRLKYETERGIETNLITTSPINSQRLSIVGCRLSDCYFFSASILPNKEDLIHELRGELRK